MVHIDPTTVRHVHVIFKTHLDVGFTDFAHKVKQRFLEEFFPQAIRIARELRESGGPDRLVWTTGSWILYEYLEWAKGQALKDAEEAVAAGDLVWGAIPFTFHSELCEPSLFRYGLSLSKQLDARFGKKTIAAKMTDVPGHTRGIVPLLAEAGVKFLHLGRNQASHAPKVPEAFRWRHTDGSEITVVYHHDYGYTSAVEGMDSAISFTHGRDNHPPQDADAVRSALARLRKKFPNAKVQASRMDDYGRKLWAHRKHLPVVEGELADTWIYGIGSHPERVQRYLALTRLRKNWIEAGRFDDQSDPAHARFSRELMCVPEHTWGIMVDDLEDTTSYEGNAFEALRRSSRAKRMEASWEEQLDYVRDAAAALGNSDLAKEAKGEISKTDARRIKPIGPKVGAGTIFGGGRFEIGFDEETGAINHLCDRESEKLWADRDHMLGLFLFENFARADFDRFMEQYNPQPAKCAWAPFVMTKFGMDAEREIRHAEWVQSLEGIHVTKVKDGMRILVDSSMPEPPVARFGCPAHLQTEYLTRPDEGRIEVTFQWFDKAASRLPGACWLSFRPVAADPDGWRLRKMDQWISPHEVVPYGNRKLHAVQEVAYRGSDGEFRIQPLDAPLVAPGQRSLLDYNQRQPRMDGGVHFNLWNNVWNTNFPYWHEGDCRFRFQMSFPHRRPGSN